jgi:transposase
MDGIIPPLDGRAKRRLVERMKHTEDADLRMRYLIVIHLAERHSPTEIARLLKGSRSQVYRVAQRFREFGEAGLIDRREDNGERKLTEDYLAELRQVVASDPPEHGWKRPTWTRELLVETLARRTGVRIAVSTMSGALRSLGARLGRPKPTVACPWPEADKQQRLQELQQLREQLPPDEVLVYEDEVDVHLNPRIGRDWMLPGQQKQVPTPGKNQKRYLAGAQDVRTGELIFVEGERKNSLLFLWLLWELVQRYPDAKVIHVILDNYSIHSTQQVQVSLDTPEGQRLRLHFLPPYCPDHNKIERTWQDLHANVTRNHNCETLAELMRNVRTYLRRRNRRTAQTAA